MISKRPIAVILLSGILLVGLCSFAIAAFAADDYKDAAADSAYTTKGKDIKLQAPLPGAGDGTTAIKAGKTQEGGYIMEYVTVIYAYLAGLAGLLAVLMMVLGGFQVMTSGTSPAGIAAGKDKIINAVGGLILLLVSAILLYTVNPNAFTVFEKKAGQPEATPGANDK